MAESIYTVTHAHFWASTTALTWALGTVTFHLEIALDILLCSYTQTYYTLASVPGLPRSVRDLIMRMRKTFAAS